MQLDEPAPNQRYRVKRVLVEEMEQHRKSFATVESKDGLLSFQAAEGAELQVSTEYFGLKLMVGEEAVLEVNKRGLFQIELKRERQVRRG